jgi:putative transposase
LIQVIRSFKSLIATRWLEWLREHAPERSAKIWQRGFYERIIRDDAELNAIREYIRDNPLRWTDRHDNLAALLHKMNPA